MTSYQNGHSITRSSDWPLELYRNKCCRQSAGVGHCKQLRGATSKGIKDQSVQSFILGLQT